LGGVEDRFQALEEGAAGAGAGRRQFPMRATMSICCRTEQVNRSGEIPERGEESEAERSARGITVVPESVMQGGGVRRCSSSNSSDWSDLSREKRKEARVGVSGYL
jgi:hypothetical protein